MPRRRLISSRRPPSRPRRRLPVRRCRRCRRRRPRPAGRIPPPPPAAAGPPPPAANPATAPAAANPAPKSGAEPDLAFGAYQRGYFLTAFAEATRRVEAKGDSRAMTLLGELYANGLGVSADDGKAAQ